MTTINDGRKTVSNVTVNALALLRALQACKHSVNIYDAKLGNVLGTVNIKTSDDLKTLSVVSTDGNQLACYEIPVNEPDSEFGKLNIFIYPDEIDDLTKSIKYNKKSGSNPNLEAKISLSEELLTITWVTSRLDIETKVIKYESRDRVFNYPNYKFVIPDFNNPDNVPKDMRKVNFHLSVPILEKLLKQANSYNDPMFISFESIMPIAVDDNQINKPILCRIGMGINMLETELAIRDASTVLIMPIKHDYSKRNSNNGKT